MGSRVYRYSVPADGHWHPVNLRGSVLHVDARNSRLVEFWAVNDDDTDETRHEVRVFGTGQPLIPADIEHVGTAVIEPYVWHLYRRTA